MSKAPQFGFTDRLKIAWSVMSGSWAGASRSRRSLSEWHPGGGDADSDVLCDLPTLRERSRDMVRNVPLAGGAINTKVTNVVGTGLRLQSQIDADFLGLTEEQALTWQDQAEREFNNWACSEDSDAERTLTFAEQQELAFRSTLENGDCFALMPFIERPGAPYGLTVQLIEADRVSNPNYKNDTDTLMGGVQKDRVGAPVRYHITNKHPGRMYQTQGMEWTAYDAFGERTGRRNVLHLYHKLRIGQSRGFPDLSPVMELVKKLGTYTDAEVDAAVVTSFFAILTKTPQRQGLGPAALGGGSTATAKSEPYKIGPALVLDLKNDEDFETVNPNRPNTAFDPFVMAVMRQIGVRLELPFEILIKHFTSSYSAARAAIEDAKRFFRMRRQWLASNFCQPIYETLLYEAVARGRLAAPGFLIDPMIRRAYCGNFNEQWIGPSFGQIDPMKEYQAREIAEDRGWITAAENTSEVSGGDWDHKIRRRKREDALRGPIGDRPAPEPDMNPGGIEQ